MIAVRQQSDARGRVLFSEELDLCDGGVLIPAYFENKQDQPFFRQQARHHIVDARCRCNDAEMRGAEDAAKTLAI